LFVDGVQLGLQLTCYYGSMRFAVLLLLAGCGFEPANHCGDVPSGLVSCTKTKARGLEPLGAATMNSIHSALAPAGNKVAAIWEEVGAAGSQLHLALVDTLGAVGTSQALGSGADPVLLRKNDQLTLFWRDGTTIYTQLVDDSGQLLNQPHTVFSGTSADFAVAWNGSEYGMLLSGANGDDYQIYWLRVDESGTVAAGPTKLTDGGNNSLQPQLVWTGCEYAAAWTDTRPGTPAVFFNHYDHLFTAKASDTPISASGLRGSFPSLAVQPTGGLVLCYEQLMGMNQDIFCSRLDATGAVTNVAQLSTTPDPSQNPHAVAHGKNMWVLWDDYRSATAVAPDVFWQFLDAGGMPLLDQPFRDPDLLDGGWRAHGVYTSDALYFIQYHGDVATGAFTAEVATENCY
jgi:hypothetical protein